MNVLGVCGGNGVMLHPFRKYLVGNIEPRAIFHSKGDLQWNANFEGIPIHKTFPYPDFKKVTILIGHPNCGHSSMLRYSRAKTLVSAKEDESVKLYFEAISRYRPKMILLENLPNFMGDEELHETLGKRYHLRIIRDSVTAFGNSQVSRKRLVLVGLSRKSFRESHLEYFTPLASPKIYTSGEILSPYKDDDLESLNVRETDDFMIPMYYHGKRKLSAKETRKLWQSEFKGLTRWPIFDNPRMKNQPGIFRLDAEKAPFTVRKQSRQFDPWGYILTPRQLAAIQGVPDWFKLVHFVDKDLNYSLNKARATVTKSPPYEVSVWFKRCIKQMLKHERNRP